MTDVGVVLNLNYIDYKIKLVNLMNKEKENGR